MDWTGVAKYRNKWPAVVSAVMNLWIAQSADHFLSSWGTTSFSRWTLLHGVNLQEPCVLYIGQA